MPSIALDTSALDPEFKEHALRGLGRYVSKLRDALDSAASPDITISSFQHTELARGSRLAGLLAHSPIGAQLLQQHFAYPARMRRCLVPRPDFVHFPAQTDVPAWCPLPYVVTVHDLIPRTMSDLYLRGKSARARFAYSAVRSLEALAIRRAGMILSISHRTADELQSHLGIPRERIRVVPLGIDELFFQTPRDDREPPLRDRYGLHPTRPLVTYVGGIDRRKNVGGLLRVVERLGARRRENHRPAPQLVIAGDVAGHAEYPELTRTIRQLGLSADVCLPGYVPDDELVRLLQASSVFSFLSLSEGFGLPPLEAMAAGVPVVASNASVMPEVLGDAALLVDPNDLESSVHAIERILDEPELSQQMSRAGRAHARKYSWRATGEATLEAYRLHYEQLRSAGFAGGR